MSFHTDDNKALIEWPFYNGNAVLCYEDHHPDYEQRMKVIRHSALMWLDDLNWMDHPQAQ